MALSDIAVKASYFAQAVQPVLDQKAIVSLHPAFGKDQKQVQGIIDTVSISAKARELLAANKAAETAHKAEPS